MTWTVTSDAVEFDRHAGELLKSEPERNTISLVLLHRALTEPEPEQRDAWWTGTSYAWWTDLMGVVTGAASATPGYPIVLACAPEIAEGHMLNAFAEAGVEVPGVNGETEAACRVAALWCAKTEGRLLPVLGEAERLFRLTTLIPPLAVPGRGRTATAADLDWLVDCLDLFALDAHLPLHSAERRRTIVTTRMADGGVRIWTDPAGERVAFAGRTAAVAGVSRVGPVFTARGHRGRGYAAGVTAMVTADALRMGSSLVLFTDITNPTSNGVYRRLGYQQVVDRAVIMFMLASQIAPQQHP